MSSNVSYLNCRSCGRVLQRGKFKSGYCPPCLRGRIAASRSLYNEALRLIGIAEETGTGSQVWSECQIYCRMLIEKIALAEHETGQTLFDGDELAILDTFMRKGVGVC